MIFSPTLGKSTASKSNFSAPHPPRSWGAEDGSSATLAAAAVSFSASASLIPPARACVRRGRELKGARFCAEQRRACRARSKKGNAASRNSQGGRVGRDAAREAVVSVVVALDVVFPRFRSPKYS